MTMRNTSAVSSILKTTKSGLKLSRHSKVENCGRSLWFISIRATRSLGASTSRLRPGSDGAATARLQGLLALSASDQGHYPRHIRSGLHRDLGNRIRKIAHLQAKRPHPVSGERSGPSQHWHRRASVTEFLVALGIVFLALVHIVSAREDEASFSPPQAPRTESKSAEIESVERAIAANSFVSLHSKRPQRSVGHYPP
jgi:hypothetical protein